ncbi:hypothetical protein L2E82_07194 [Cichorium intybus]|uniref:Uncharacterized protein n=1 Tax=Cichorium intybus TaxID=13427 RepID=A0ACB9G508_CICIN|nr:hypothetical protein L2E82_07194 [Cichorium intybus]
MASESSSSSSSTPSLSSAIDFLSLCHRLKKPKDGDTENTRSPRMKLWNCDILMNDVEGAWEKSMSRKVFVKMLSPTEIAFMGHLADFNHSVKFKEAAKDGNLIPLYRSIFSDHRTPVLAYRCLVKEDDRDAPIFFVIGAQPTMEIVAKENMVTVMDHQEGRKTEEFVEDPMVVPRSIMEQWSGRAAVQMKNALYVTGGFDGKSYSSLDPREKKWSKIADMNKRKGCHSIVVSNEKAQVC